MSKILETYGPKEVGDSMVVEHHGGLVPDHRLVWISPGSMTPGAEVSPTTGQVFSVHGIAVEEFNGNDTGQSWD